MRSAAEQMDSIVAANAQCHFVIQALESHIVTWDISDVYENVGLSDLPLVSGKNCKD